MIKWIEYNHWKSGLGRVMNIASRGWQKSNSKNGGYDGSDEII